MKRKSVLSEPVVVGKTLMPRKWRSASLINYQWQKKVRGRWRDIPGATGPMLTITSRATVRCCVELWDKNGSTIIHGRANRPEGK